MVGFNVSNISIINKYNKIIVAIGIYPKKSSYHFAVWRLIAKFAEERVTYA